MINDGSPNVAKNFLYNKNGLIKVPIFFTTRDIQEGEEITYSYGGVHNIKFSDYYLSQDNYRRVVDTLARTPLTSFFSHLRERLSISSAPNKSEYDFSAKKKEVGGVISYILETPIVLYRLVADGHLATNHLFSFFKEDFDLLFKIPMLPANILSAFLLAKVRKACQEQGQMEHFKHIMEIITQHFARPFRAHSNHDMFMRLCFTKIQLESLGYLCDTLTQPEPDSFKVAVEKFEELYARSHLYENESRQEKDDLMVKLNEDLNDTFAELMIRHDLV